jgi:hypothetical protein
LLGHKFHSIAPLDPVLASIIFVFKKQRAKTDRKWRSLVLFVTPMHNPVEARLRINVCYLKTSIVVLLFAKLDFKGSKALFEPFRIWNENRPFLARS